LVSRGTPCHTCPALHPVRKKLIPWLDRLTLGRRLLLVALIAAIPLFVVSIALISHSYDSRIEFALQERRGILFLRPIEQLLDLIPRYQAALPPGAAGVDGAPREAAELARQIDGVLDTLRANYQGPLGRTLNFTDDSLASHSREQGRLAVVSAAWLAFQAAPNFAARAEIVDQLETSLRAMAAHAGDTSNLILDNHLDSYYLMDIAVVALPRAQERLGDITVQVSNWLREGTVSGHHDDIAVMDSRLHQDNLGHIASDARISLSENLASPHPSASLQKDLPTAVARYSSASHPFLALVNRVLAGASISPAEFAAAGWNDRAESFRLWQVATDELDRMLALRVAELRQERWNALAIDFLTLVLAALAIGWIIHGLVVASYNQALKLNEELSAKEARLRALGDRLPDSVVYQIVRETDGTMRFLYVSAGVEQINGLSAEDVLRDYSLFFNQVIDQGILVAAREASVRSLALFEAVVRLRRADGQLRWIRLSAAPRLQPDGRIIWDGIERDITERTRVETALRQSEEKFAKVFRASPDAIVITELESGLIIDANASFGKLFGYAREEVVSRTGLELGIFDDLYERQRMVQAVSASGSVHDWEMNVRHRSGARIAIFFSGELIEFGDRICMVSVIHDITERKQAEARERQARDEFTRKLLASQETERRRIAGELHDGLGQNLILIKHRAQLAGNLAAEAPALRLQFQQLQDMTAQAIAEVRQISHDLRPHHLDQLGLTRSLEAMIQATAQSSQFPIEHHLDAVDDLFTPEAATHLYRVVQESISNILKHAQARGARIVLERDVREVSLCIEDDGQGFAAPALHSPAPAGGLGLGSMAERVRILGGALRVDSVSGRGTRIEVVIPHSGDA